MESGTTWLLFPGAALALLLIALLTSGLGLLVLPFAPLVAWWNHKKALALIHGSGVLVSANQFREIHRCVHEFRNRLSMKKKVDVYIVESNVANAFAVKHGATDVILLTDDLVHGCLASGHPHALSFVIGHELGHIALGHTGFFRTFISNFYKKLARMDEHSADAVGSALVGDPQISFQGLLLMTVGYGLIPFVDQQSLSQQAREVAQDKQTKKAERPLTHPLLLHRLSRVLQTHAF